MAPAPHLELSPAELAIEASDQLSSDPISRSGRPCPKGLCYTLASRTCHLCKGMGQRATYEKDIVRWGEAAGQTKSIPKVCCCVYREIFRQCEAQYNLCRGWQASCRTCVSADGRRLSYGRRAEEFIADFEGLSHRFLPAQLQRIFVAAVITADGAEPRGFSRSAYWYRVCVMRELLGEALLDAGLWPASRYFGGSSHVAASTYWVEEEDAERDTRGMGQAVGWRNSGRLFFAGAA